MKGIFGLFTYFSQLDRDGSGYLERDEIEYLAEMFFGQNDQEATKKYVNEVFDKFDYDNSGELSYEEARDFIKDVYQFIDQKGGISDEQRDKFLSVMDHDDSPAAIEQQTKKTDSPAVGPNGELLGPDGKPLLGPNGELLGPDGKPLLGPNGEMLGPDGKPVLGPDGKPLGPDGKPVTILPAGVKLGPDGKPLLGPGGCLLGADGKPLLGPNGEMLGPDGKPLLGPNGELLGPDGKPIVGPGGVALGPDGKPLLGPDGKPLMADVGEDEINPVDAQESSALRDFNFEIDPEEMARRAAEQEARRKALMAGLKEKKKRFEVRQYENDGWCKILQIWRPKATVDVDFVKKSVKSKWFRDPNTDQWVSRARVENPQPKEPAPASVAAPSPAA